MVCRVSPAFIRFGTFQLPSTRPEDLGLVRRLADYTIRHHYPHLEGAVSLRHSRWNSPETPPQSVGLAAVALQWVRPPLDVEAMLERFWLQQALMTSMSCRPLRLCMVVVPQARATSTSAFCVRWCSGLQSLWRRGKRSASPTASSTPTTCPSLGVRTTSGFHICPLLPGVKSPIGVTHGVLINTDTMSILGGAHRILHTLGYIEMKVSDVGLRLLRVERIAAARVSCVECFVRSPLRPSSTVM